MRSDAKQLINVIIEDLYEKVDRLETEIVLNQQEYPHIVPHLVSVQQSLRLSLRLAEGCLVDAAEERH
ncbi:MAG TPA: hypothetical protein VGN01_15130 [Acidobacteriaceae bacterium]